MLRDRIISSVIMVLLLIGLLWLDHQSTQYSGWWTNLAGCVGGPLTLLILLLIAKGGHELLRMYREIGLQPVPCIGTGWAMAVIISTYLQPISNPWLNLMPVMVYGWVAAVFAQALFRRSDRAITQVAVTAMTAMYLGVLASFVLLIRVDFGLVGLLLLIIPVKLADVGAYFVGRSMGRRKLIPWLSAGKTVEGTIGGILVGAAAAVFLNLVCDIIGVEMTHAQALAFGLVVGAIGQLGDLMESLLKRDAARKDSGQAIPGFGGIMDVVDSLLLAAPVGYALLKIWE